MLNHGFLKLAMMSLPLVLFRLVLALLIVSGCGCASAPPALPRIDALLHDDYFGSRPDEVRAEPIFAIDDSMRHYLQQEMAASIRQHGPARGLLDALYDRSKLKLEYDAVRTRNATEAFSARQGNCLSLVIMTATFARELGLDVRFQQVHTSTEWRREGNLFVTAGHVNLRLATQPRNWETVSRSSNALVVDFLPSNEAAHAAASEIREATVIAMFMNNRAAEALSAGDLNLAYWWAREALRQDHGFIPAYSTLALAYSRHSRLSAAIEVLTEALRQTPDDAVVLANLAGFLRTAGRNADAQLLEARLHTIEPYPPYHFFLQGLAALQAADYRQAQTLMSKDLARQPYNPEFHFGLAAVYLAQGELNDARIHLERAHEYSTSKDRRALYSAKLEWLENRQRCRKGFCENSS